MVPYDASFIFYITRLIQIVLCYILLFRFRHISLALQTHMPKQTPSILKFCFFLCKENMILSIQEADADVSLTWAFTEGHLKKAVLYWLSFVTLKKIQTFTTQ